MRGQRRTSRTLAAAGLVLALLGAACADSGGDGGANAGSGGDSSSPAATGAGGGGGYGGYGGGGGGSTGSSGSGGGGAMTLTQVNFLFTPAKLTVKQGDTITVKNTNPSTPHTFTVTGTDIDVANDPLASKDVAIDLEPGTYDFVCRFHEGQGMIGTLVVK